MCHCYACCSAPVRHSATCSEVLLCERRLPDAGKVVASLSNTFPFVLKLFFLSVRCCATCFETQQHWRASRSLTKTGLVRCAKTAGPNHLGDRDLVGSSLYIAAGFGFRNLLGRLSDSFWTASRNERHLDSSALGSSIPRPE